MSCVSAMISTQVAPFAQIVCMWILGLKDKASSLWKGEYVSPESKVA